MMDYLHSIFPAGSVSTSLAILSLAVVVGLAAGNVRVRGISLGVSAVLFVALVFGWLGMTIEDDVVSFLRDFALILFVYPIGLQVGPSFVASLRAEGLRLNLLALAVVTLGAVAAVAVVMFAGLPKEMSAGVYTGGFATTPGLAAAEEGLRDKFAAEAGQADVRRMMASVFAAAYPFGLLGPIILVVLFRWMFRVDVPKEVQALRDEALAKRPPIGIKDVEITNPVLEGVSIKDDHRLRERGIVLSRLLRGNVLSVPNAETVVRVGDVYRVVGPLHAVEELTKICGREKPIDLRNVTGDVERADFVFTARHNLGKTLRAINLTQRFGVTLTRIERAGVELAPKADLELRFGDAITAVGPTAGLKSAEAELGNSIDELNRPQLIPIFLGIVLGVLVGSIPLAVPGLSTGMRIGLAGGPMIVAIVLSHFGRAGRLVWYMPPSANLLLRDFGMAIFLACVGLKSGAEFFDLVLHGDGLRLMCFAAIVTVGPMFVVGVAARLIWKMNYVTLTGLTAGAMTSSPTLLFANDLTKSTVPSVAYATVYPVSMLAPVIWTQVLVGLTV